MEGAAMKFPSFKSLAPNAISMSRAAAGHHSFSRVRPSFSLSAASAAYSSPTIAADSESVSLGHRLRKDFPILHQMCGPTGVGFLYGKSDLLHAMPPFLSGGEMIEDVSLDHSTYAEPPSRFEAGTPPIGEAKLSGIGMAKIHEYELVQVDLGNYLYEILSSLPGVRIYRPKPSESVHRAALCLEGLHPTDLATYLYQELVQVDLGNYLYEILSSLPGVRIYRPKPSESVHRAALCLEGLHPTDLATYLDQEHGVAINQEATVESHSTGIILE